MQANLQPPEIGLTISHKIFVVFAYIVNICDNQIWQWITSVMDQYSASTCLTNFKQVENETCNRSFGNVFQSMWWLTHGNMNLFDARLLHNFQ